MVFVNTKNRPEWVDDVRTVIFCIIFIVVIPDTALH